MLQIVAVSCFDSNKGINQDKELRERNDYYEMVVKNIRSIEDRIFNTSIN